LDLRWCLVSVVLVLSPESREEVQLAVTRIKANLVAAISSMGCLLLGPANAFSVALAFGITTALCFGLRLMPGNRSALAAVIIIMIRDENGFHLTSALGRVVSVVAGCIVALGVTFVFHFELEKLRFWTSKDKQQESNLVQNPHGVVPSEAEGME
jgi:uncharacterized membrane protein YgaE (UPF0421/DUF939 family)